MQLNDGPRKDGRRRRRRRRGGSRSRGASPNNQQQQQQRVDPNDERLRGANPTPTGPEALTAFNLFCAYHLGITRDNGYKFQSVGEVARRFNVDVAVVKEKLTEFRLDTETLRATGFDSELAQLDIKVAPEGVSRFELARTMWKELDLPEPEMGSDLDDDDLEDDDLDDDDLEDDDLDADVAEA